MDYTSSLLPLFAFYFFLNGNGIGTRAFWFAFGSVNAFCQYLKTEWAFWAHVFPEFLFYLSILAVFSNFLQNVGKECIVDPLQDSHMQWKAGKLVRNHYYSKMISSLLFTARCLDWLHWLKAGWSVWFVVRIFWWHQWVRHHFLSPALEILLWSSRISDCNKGRWQDRFPFRLLQVKINIWS